ncbi:MAG: hypothetical protein ACVCEJ_00355 [Candidatus Izemoplasmataceae bacterium]
MSKEEFSIELAGVIGTIKSYTSDPFIIGYISELKKALENEQMYMAKLIISKLIGWYNEQIEDILVDRYVYNKDAHKKSYQILKNYVTCLT